MSKQRRRASPRLAKLERQHLSYPEREPLVKRGWRMYMTQGMPIGTFFFVVFILEVSDDIVVAPESKMHPSTLSKQVCIFPTSQCLRL
jgi:hypothetical protein